MSQSILSQPVVLIVKVTFRHVVERLREDPARQQCNC